MTSRRNKRDRGKREPVSRGFFYGLLGLAGLGLGVWLFRSRKKRRPQIPPNT